eukprot:2977721-Amphidinium_carterae.1
MTFVISRASKISVRSTVSDSIEAHSRKKSYHERTHCRPTDCHKRTRPGFSESFFVLTDHSSDTSSDTVWKKAFQPERRVCGRYSSRR